MYRKMVQLEEVVSKIIFAVIVVLVLAASLGRWSGYPIVWSVDMAQLLFIWLSFLGAAQAMRRGEHIGVDVLTRRLKKKTQEILVVVHFVIIICFLCLLIYFGMQLTLLNLERKFSDSNLSYAYVTVAVPIGSLLLVFSSLQRLLAALKAIGDRGAAGEEGRVR